MSYKRHRMPDSLYQLISKFFIFYLPLLFSLCVHEWAHARVALMKGDTLAQMQGRLSLNPAAHVDLIGTIILPLLSIFTGLPVFGWAKPVPVNMHVLTNPKNDMFWIALAGPLSNLCLSVIGAFLLIPLYGISHYFSLTSLHILILTTEIFIYLNLLLCCFNLIPLHPLDGGKVLARFLPASWNWYMEQNQYYLSLALIIVFITGGFRYLALPVHWISTQMIFVAKWLSYLL